MKLDASAAPPRFRVHVGRPESIGELAERAERLAGRSVDDIAATLDVPISTDAVRTKGKLGELAEHVLGATGGSAAFHDFPHLGVELKTIPIDVRGVPRESTYVCTVPIGDAERAEWDTSWARSKLTHVLFLPIELPARRFGQPLFWRPTGEQDAVLRGDFEDALGTIAVGGVEGLDARSGRWLQVRPKARDGRARTMTRGREGELIPTIPRGFYLRARFTGAILRDPAALP